MPWCADCGWGSLRSAAETALLVFLGFVGLAVLVRPGDTMRESFPLRALVAYAIFFSLLAGVGRGDWWPFATWRYVRYTAADSGAFLQAVAVDENGQEHSLDARAFEPLELAELSGHLDLHIERMPQDKRDALLGFMLARARAGLQRLRAGQPVGSFQRFLGPLAAPVFHVETRPWRTAAELPQDLTELRIYRVHWRLSEDSARIVERRLVASAAR